MAVNFDRIVPIYDFLAHIVYGDSIRQAQVFFLDSIKPNSRVLILGGGSGWLLDELAKINTDVFVDYVEASEKMLRKAKSRSSLPFKSLVFIHGTEDSIKEQKYDFVITPFVLDVFPQNEMEGLAAAVKQLMAKGAYWLCVDFNCRDRSIKAKFLSYVMVRFFRIVSGLKITRVLDYFSSIEQLGLEAFRQRYFYGKFIRSVLYREVK